MKLDFLSRLLPGWKNMLLALFSSVLLILAFPDFDYWFLAWFALVPLMWAVEREKESTLRSFVLGWIFGTAFFFGTCWWLAYAPIHYAAFPPLFAYSLVLAACLGAGIFTAIFAGVLSILHRQFGSRAIFAAPFVWVFAEFLRYWFTGNNWNALGYSQAFGDWLATTARQASSVGGVLLASGYILAINCTALMIWLNLAEVLEGKRRSLKAKVTATLVALFIVLVAFPLLFGVSDILIAGELTSRSTPVPVATVVGLQPNVPMSGLALDKWRELRLRHVRLAETALTNLKDQFATTGALPTILIFPESPMNFEYDTDPETKRFIDSFAAEHDVSLLFNSAEPDRSNGKFFNSAVMVSPEGREVAQYDKIYLLPFGEAVPVPFESLVPAFVGSFSYGKEYDQMPIGDAKAGVMICFESHFGQLSRRYVADGADVIIEMTNDGYLGPTPVLRQHLANAVFRAIETNRPILRVTNVGITAYINERGEVLDAAAPYTEDTKVWSVSKSDGSQTFYVRFGDWFAWLCTLVTIGLIGFAIRRRESVART